MTRSMLVSFVVTAVLWISLSSTTAGQEWPVNRQSIEEVLSRLRSPDRKRRDLKDMHGNASDELQALMIARFSATSRVCAEIERLDGAGDEDLRRALYRVLGFVKDPDSIPWLETRLQANHAADIFDMWLPEWGAYRSGAEYDDLKWLEGTYRWSQFFQRTLTIPVAAEHRTRILYAMQAWLHDPDTLSFFTQLEKSPDAPGIEVLIAQVYLRQHGKPYDVELLKTAIDEVRGYPKGRYILADIALELRDGAFLPVLIENVGPGQTKAKWGDFQWTLEAITLRLNATGEEAWRSCFETHGSKGRSAWVADAMERLEALLNGYPHLGRAFFKDAVGRWNDPVLLPYMLRFADHEELHESLVSWMNLAYRPHWRPQFEELARRIIERRGKGMDLWSRNLLMRWDFLKSEQDTWEWHVRRDNMRV